MGRLDIIDSSMKGMILIVYVVIASNTMSDCRASHGGIPGRRSTAIDDTVRSHKDVVGAGRAGLLHDAEPGRGNPARPAAV